MNDFVGVGETKEQLIFSCVEYVRKQASNCTSQQDAKYFGKEKSNVYLTRTPRQPLSQPSVSPVLCGVAMRETLSLRT